MRPYPMIQTDRLFLRPFFITDAKDVQELAGDRQVSDMLFTFDPSQNGISQQWIIDQHEFFEQGKWVNLAITESPLGIVIGSVGLDIDPEHNQAEIAYWLGKMYWGKGYATEAARATLEYGFEELHLHRVYARFLARNPASGRVLKKIGMTWEGRLRQHLEKNGIHEDLEVMGILKQEFLERRSE